MTIEIVDLPIDSMVIFQFVMGRFTNQIMSIICDMFQREMDKLLACECVCKNLLEPVQNIGLQLGRLECVCFSFSSVTTCLISIYLYSFIIYIYIYISPFFSTTTPSMFGPFPTHCRMCLWRSSGDETRLDGLGWYFDANNGLVNGIPGS